MRIKLTLILLVLITNSCIELYEFDVQSNSSTLVVEGSISNKSYNDTRNYPSDGRLFFVKLRTTSQVSNQHDKAVSRANVVLEDSDGASFPYEESWQEEGKYYLLDSTFSASEGKSYRLRIALDDGESYESDWEKMVDTPVLPMGEISFEEVQEKAYYWRFGEQAIRIEDGINIMIDLPPNTSGKPLYYRWDFTPTWIFIAPLSSIADYGHKCWVSSDLFLKNYTFAKDEVGGVKNKIMYMSLYRNEKVFQKLSLLITQQVMTERYYRFWKEMYEQTQRGGLFDAAPYNLDTNFKQVGGEGKRVSGYFGVVKEQATRWYFDRKDLSYYLDDYLYQECNIYGLEPGPDCFSCLAYERTGGVPDVNEPWWWED